MTRSETRKKGHKIIRLKRGKEKALEGRRRPSGRSLDDPELDDAQASNQEPHRAHFQHGGKFVKDLLMTPVRF